MFINIKPVDTLFFGDSKPFIKKKLIKSEFPPFPHILYKSLIDKTLDDIGCTYKNIEKGNFVLDGNEAIGKMVLEKIKSEINDSKGTETFKLKGSLLFYNDSDLYFKLPADVKKISNGNSIECKTMYPFNWSNYNVQTDFDLFKDYPHTITDGKIVDIDESYISLKNFVDYALGNEIKHIDLISEKKIFNFEIQPVKGSSRNIDGIIDTVGYIRLKSGWSLCAKIENLSLLKKSGFIKLGTTDNVCEYTMLPETSNPFEFYFSQIDKIKSTIENNKKFRIILLTPAIYNKGCLSDKFDRNLEYWIDNNLKIKLISYVINKFDRVLIYSSFKSKTKYLKKAVPAGSVYYFELLEGSINRLFEKMNFINFSDEGSNFGFGLTLIGGIKNV